MTYAHNFFNDAAPGSVWRTSDPATIKKIKRAMRQADDDAVAFERWVRAGCISPGLSDTRRLPVELT